MHSGMQASREGRGGGIQNAEGAPGGQVPDAYSLSSEDTRI